MLIAILKDTLIILVKINQLSLTTYFSASSSHDGVHFFEVLPSKTDLVIGELSFFVDLTVNTGLSLRRNSENEALFCETKYFWTGSAIFWVV